MKQRSCRDAFQWYLSNPPCLSLVLLFGILTTTTNAWTTTTIHHGPRRKTTRVYDKSPDLVDGNSRLVVDNGLLIVGFGRVGQQVAKLASSTQQILSAKDDEESQSSLAWNQIVGTVRDAEKATAINAAASIDEDDDNASCSTISCIPVSKLQSELLGSNDSCHYSHVLIAMPPVDEIYQTVLDALASDSSTITWLGMVSTTGVYGNHDGNWVTEESKLKCGSNSTAAGYVEWEEAFRDCCQARNHGPVVRIFRCAGIYDATRSALHTLWKQAPKLPDTPTPNKVESKTNRIHVTDIAQAIVRSMMMIQNNKDSFEIYNLSDDLPERRSKVMEYASTLLTKRLGKDWRSKSVGGGQRVLDANNDAVNDKSANKRETKSVRRRRREQEPKLIDNQKLKTTLLTNLQYPSYQEGLNAILLDPQAPWNNLEENTMDPE